jgi:hypothetical protein
VIVKTEKPPIYDRAEAIFGPVVATAIFAWGDCIYNPGGGAISSWLLDHEKVHGARQLIYPKGIEGWWDEYLKDSHFRLVEEIYAHKAEYASYCYGSGSQSQRLRTRNERRLYLKVIAKRLSGVLYGQIISYEKAMDLIKL